MLSRATAARRLATDPLVPLLSLTALGLLATLGVAAGLVVPALTWAVLGGLAGYTLSGSVWTRNSAFALSSPGWRERDRQAVVLGAFSVGLVLGGVLSGLVLWLLSGLASALPTPVRYAMVLGFALVAVLRDAGAVRFRLPQNGRQVPREVLRSPLRGALRFGFELGTGVRTYLSATAPYVVALALLLIMPGLPATIAAGAGFGLGRAATPLVRFASGAGEAWDAVLSSRLRLLAAGGGAVVAVLLCGVVFGQG